MAVMAIDIDVLDRNWRLMVCQAKPCTRRGARFARCNPRRARGDDCYDHGPRGEGHRILAVERLMRHQPVGQVSAIARTVPREINQAPEPEPVVVSVHVATRPRRVFDPAIDHLRDELRGDIRDIELKLPFARRRRTRRNLYKQLMAAKMRLEVVEATARTTV